MLLIWQVGFNLLGLSFLAGSIGLRGRLEAIPDGGKNNVTVNFDPPQLSLAGIHLRIGPPSTVQLKTTYLDGRIRCGLGGRGSLFVFRRGGQSEGEGASQHAFLADICSSCGCNCDKRFADLVKGRLQTMNTKGLTWEQIPCRWLVILRITVSCMCTLLSAQSTP